MSEVIFVRNFLWKEFVYVVDRIGTNLPIKMQDQNIRAYVCGAPIIMSSTCFYFIPLLIDKKDRSKLNEVMKNYKKRFMFDNTIDKYDDIHNKVSLIVDESREYKKKYKLFEKVKRGIIFYFSIIRNVFRYNITI